MSNPRRKPNEDVSTLRWARGWVWLAVLFLLIGSTFPRLLLHDELERNPDGSLMLTGVAWNWVLPFIGETNPRERQPFHEAPEPMIFEETPPPQTDWKTIWSKYHLWIMAALAIVGLFVRPMLRGWWWIVVALLPALVGLGQAIQAGEPPAPQIVLRTIGVSLSLVEIHLLALGGAITMALLPAIAHHMRARISTVGRSLLMLVALATLVWHVYQTMPTLDFVKNYLEVEDPSLSDVMDIIQMAFNVFAVVALAVPALVLSARPSFARAGTYLRICRIGMVAFLLKEIARADRRMAMLAEPGEQLFAAFTVGLPQGMSRAAPTILLATGLALVFQRLGARKPPDADVFT